MGARQKKGGAAKNPKKNKNEKKLTCLEQTAQVE
jgi:hypothetical protein